MNSLTEKYVINSILYLRADLDVEVINTPRHVFESELISRVIAISTSLFAFIDAVSHASKGIYQLTYLLLRQRHIVKAPHFTLDQSFTLLKQAAFFVGLVVVGSVVATIFPQVFKYYHTSPSLDLHDAPETVREFIEFLENYNYSEADFNDFWNKSTLNEKRWFVNLLNKGDRSAHARARSFLQNKIFRSAVSNSDVQWRSLKEIIDFQASDAFYFHATSEKGLESILKTKRVEVRHEKAFRGAFVSTRPETEFGSYTLAFKKNIERLSPLNHGFAATYPNDYFNAYWAGFARDIPVEEETLAYIILNKGNESERAALESKCEKWANRKVRVITMEDATDKLHKVDSLKMGIPKEWPQGENQPMLEKVKSSITKANRREEKKHASVTNRVFVNKSILEAISGFIKGWLASFKRKEAIAL